MLFIIAVLYFLGVQSVAPHNCPRLRCTSRRSINNQDVRFKCSLSTGTVSSASHFNVVPNVSTSSLVDGSCVTDLNLETLRGNSTKGNQSTSTLQLLLQQLSGLGLKGNDARLVCNTEPMSSRVYVWQQCKQRVPRLEVVEKLSLDNNVVCVVCEFGPGDPELVYHSIAQTVLLRMVSKKPSHDAVASSTSLSSTNVANPSVILDLRLFATKVKSEVGNGLTKSRKNCRWKCGSLSYCLLSESFLCDGIRHCPSGQDEAWCKRPVAARDSGVASDAPILGLPLVYALITLGCILGFVFLLLCFLWAFCSRPAAPHLSSRRRRRRQRQPHISNSLPPPCPSCSPSLSRATAALVDASGTNSSSGVFEDSSSCAHCGVRLWMDDKIYEESRVGASDTSSAISGCMELDSGTVETLICTAPSRPTHQQTGNNLRSWTSFADSRNRGSFESIVCHSTASMRHYQQYRSSRPPRHIARFQGLNLTMPSHQQDWFLNLPATVRRSNDDTEPRPVHSPNAAESGRLLPPPNLNPFLEEPNFRCQTVASCDD